ncbi:MAG: nuclear transport factor 2 family protein [Acidobacteria bacterium]|nr:nuclear transport factor 2 family protein [Acidobacteriota bacterium]
MRVPLLAAAASILMVLMFAGVHLQAMQATAGDEQEIQRLIASHAAASRRGDLRALVDVYHADADVRYSDGTMLRGRAELEKSYRQSQ